MSQEHSNLKVGYWNIEGLKISSSLPKTEDIRFIEEVKKHDLFCIAETHCDNDQSIDIENYKCFKICRSKNRKNNRTFGGLAVLYKNSLQNGIKFLEHKNSDYVWVKLCRNFFSLSQDVYICVAYIPPEHSTFYKTRGENTLMYIETDIMKYGNIGSVILLGDLNARTGVELDYIANDTDAYMSNNKSYIIDRELLPRISQDSAHVCPRGKILLDLCNSAQLRILNGRTMGDISGVYTCHKYNGSSVVDYLIASEGYMKNIMYLQIRDFLGDLSDHCSLSFMLKCNNSRNVDFYDDTSRPFPNSFIWDSSSILKYQYAFTNESVIKCIDNYINCENDLSEHGINDAVHRVTAMYIEAAKIGLHKRKRKNDTKKTTRLKLERTPCKKWFTKDLQILKSKVLKLGRSLQIYPNTPEVRGLFFRTMKTYNKKRKLAHRDFKKQMVSKLDDLRCSDPQAYWKLLKEMKGVSTNPNEKIPLSEWQVYFKDLNQPIKNTNGAKITISDLEKLEKVPNFNEMNFKITPVEIMKSIKKLKNKKASGLDNVSNEMIKYSQHAMLPVLTKLFNNLLLSGTYPRTWCQAYIVPIPKGTDTTLMSNFRGLTILSSLAKLFNSIINERITRFLESKKLLMTSRLVLKRGVEPQITGSYS